MQGDILMEKTTCCFTGHREIPDEVKEKLEVKLGDIVSELITRGVKNFRCGGNLGFDTLAAFSIVRLKAVAFPFIKLTMVLSADNQAAYWTVEENAVYQKLLDQADEVVYIPERGNKDYLSERSYKLVDGSQVCVCYVTNDSGGAAFTVEYAREKGLEIINVA